jgi:beta-galactosidase
MNPPVHDLLLASAALATASLISAEPGASNDRLALDGQWRFKLAANAEAAQPLARFHEASFDASAFQPIPVPANWELQGFAEPHYVNGTEEEGFYLHTFAVPQTAEGRRALLRFGGVWQSAEVWLNGRLLGRHDSGFTAFAFDVTAALKPGADNRLAVRVRQRTPSFKFDANDDWALAGIYRSVWLEFTPKDLYLENVEVVTQFDPDFRDADLRLRVFVMRNEKGDYYVPSPPFEVRAVLSRTDGTEVQRETVTATIVNGHNGRDVPMTLRVRRPAPWTAETPNLYDVRVELMRNGQVVHAWRDRIGFREVSTAGGVLRINGQAVKLRGVCRHDLNAEVGRATRPQDWEQDIRLMKAANINAVRTAHYPPAEGFVRLCDALGLYVLEEIPYGFGGDRMNDPLYTEGAYLRVHETVARDRNRPSVIIWDLGNEDPFTALHLATLRALKGLDPTRPVLMPFHSEEDMPPEIDILAPHYRKAAEYDQLAAAARRPIVTTEYTHALGTDAFGGLQERWDALTRHPAGAGGMIWLWADQGIRRPIKGRPVLPEWADRTKVTREGSELVRHKDAGPDAILDAHGNYGTDGIVDADRKPQTDYWETKGVYAPVRVLVDRLPMAPGQGSIAIPLRNDFDFLDLSTVGVSWKLYRDATVLDGGETSLSAAPHTTTTLVVPAKALTGAAGSHYLHLFFHRSDGTEITRRSVRLELPGAPPAATAPVGGRAVATRSGDKLTVTAGAARYDFDAWTGELASIAIGPRWKLGRASIAVWRPPSLSELNQLDRRPAQHPWRTHLQDLAGAARDWKFTEEADGLTITATTEYRADEKNVIAVDWTYRVTAAGGLRLSYVVKPTLDVDWLPEVGVAVKSEAAPQTIAWLGLGPTESLPNRTASVLYGHWTARPGSPELQGTRCGVDWLRVEAGDGSALLVRGIAGFRYEGADAPMLKFFTHLAGAWTKNGPPERPEWRLELKPGTSFSGTFELQPVAAPRPALAGAGITPTSNRAESVP